MSATKVRETGILPYTPAADYSDKLGYTVDLAAGTATISASATVVAKGVIVEGSTTTGKTSVAILGNIDGTVLMKLSGTVARDAHVQQAADGTVVTDAGTGARVIVGVACEGGVSGELIEVAPITPRVYAS